MLLSFQQFKCHFGTLKTLEASRALTARLIGFLEVSQYITWGDLICEIQIPKLQQMKMVLPT